MCRFVFYQGQPIRLAEMLTEPTHSLINQSIASREREEPLNGDGFGLAWYTDARPEPALFRSVTPAWSNQNLEELARVVESDCVLAHIRAATQGSVSEQNCHPFRRGNLAFMHNGDIGGFDHLRRALLGGLSDRAFEAIEGRTDSEHFFALIDDVLDGGEDEVTPLALLDALQDAIDRVQALSARHAPHEFLYLNAVLTDGAAAVVCRYTDDAPDRGESLYINQGGRFVCEDGVCRMIDPGRAGGTLLVASEPLSSDPGWERIAPNTALVILNGQLLQRVAL